MKKYNFGNFWYLLGSSGSLLSVSDKVFGNSANSFLFSFPNWSKSWLILIANTFVWIFKKVILINKMKTFLYFIFEFETWTGETITPEQIYYLHEFSLKKQSCKFKATLVMPRIMNKKHWRRQFWNREKIYNSNAIIMCFWNKEKNATLQPTLF